MFIYLVLIFVYIRMAKFINFFELKNPEGSQGEYEYNEITDIQEYLRKMKINEDVNIIDALKNPIGKGALNKTFYINDEIALRLMYKGGKKNYDSEIEGLKNQNTFHGMFNDDNNNPICKVISFGKYKSNIPEFLTNSETERAYAFIEYINGGELFDYMAKKKLEQKLIPLNVIKHIIKNILEAIKVIHGKGYIFFDLKLENIMLVNDPDSNSIQKVEEKAKIKLIDFGMLQLKDTKPEFLKGTPGYKSKTLHNHVKINTDISKYWQQIDIWSIGIILYWLLRKVDPRISIYREEINDRIEHQIMCPSEENYENVKNKYDKETADFLKKFFYIGSKKNLILQDLKLIMKKMNPNKNKNEPKVLVTYNPITYKEELDLVNTVEEAENGIKKLVLEQSKEKVEQNKEKEEQDIFSFKAYTAKELLEDKWFTDIITTSGGSRKKLTKKRKLKITKKKKKYKKKKITKKKNKLR